MAAGRSQPSLDSLLEAIPEEEVTAVIPEPSPLIRQGAAKADKVTCEGCGKSL